MPARSLWHVRRIDWVDISILQWRRRESAKMSVRGTQTKHTPSTTSGHQQHVNDVVTYIKTSSTCQRCSNMDNNMRSIQHPKPLSHKLSLSILTNLINIFIRLCFQFYNLWLVHNRSTKGACYCNDNIKNSWLAYSRSVRNARETAFTHLGWLPQSVIRQFIIDLRDDVFGLTDSYY